MVAAIFEAPLNREQADELARLMRESRDRRVPGVLSWTLLLENGVGRIAVVWTSKDALDRYLSVTPVPRGAELMRSVGAEPSFRVVDCLEYG